MCLKKRRNKLSFMNSTYLKRKIPTSIRSTSNNWSKNSQGKPLFKYLYLHLLLCLFKQFQYQFSQLGRFLCLNQFSRCQDQFMLHPHPLNHNCSLSFLKGLWLPLSQSKLFRLQRKFLLFLLCKRWNMKSFMSQVISDNSKNQSIFHQILLYHLQ